MYFYSVNFMANPKYVENFVVSIRNDSKGISRANLSGTLLSDLVRATALIIVKAGFEYSKDPEYTLVRATVDTCQIAKGVIGNFLVKMVTDQLDQYSNYKFECPQKQGYYHVTDFPAVDDKYIPHFLIGKSGYGEIFFDVKTKVGSEKKMVKIFTIKGRGMDEAKLSVLNTDSLFS